VEALYREQVLADAKYEQIIAGEPSAKKKRIYRQALVRRYGRNTDDEEENDDGFSMMDYLHGIAHNVSY